MSVISVIGPDAHAVEQVTAGARRAGGRPARRFVAGAGPGEADGVVAVVTSPTVTADDLEVVRAVRDAMGIVVLYTAAECVAGELNDEPGVVHCRWGGDGCAGMESVAGLLGVVDGLWVDVDRWEADARRADADRLDRVRIAVRLAADRAATELLDGGGGTGVAGGARDAEFRARLSVAVLEQGVEMPHLPPSREVAVDAPAPTQGAALARLVTVAAAVGAGLASAAGVLRLTDSVMVALVVGVVVLGGTAGVRWWTGRTARREQAEARRATALRRHWAATVTDVVGRLTVPPVAGRLPGGAS